MDLDPFWLQIEGLQGIADLAHALVGQLGPLHKVTLVLVAVFAAHEQHGVVTIIDGVSDPAHTDTAQATYRNHPHPGVIIDTIHTGHVEGRIGIVFTSQHQDTRLLLKLIGNLNCL